MEPKQEMWAIPKDHFADEEQHRVISHWAYLVRLKIHSLYGN